MKPFFIQLDSGQQLKITPGTDVFMDGHPILTHTYIIHRKTGDSDLNELSDAMDSDTKTDPHYLGLITFDEPGKIFSYTRDGHDQLDSGDLQEVISQITEYRESPSDWNL